MVLRVWVTKDLRDHRFLSLVFGNIYIYLVGGIPTPLKNMKVSWGYEIPNIWKNKSQVPNHQPDPYLKICMGTIGINLGIPKYK